MTVQPTRSTLPSAAEIRKVVCLMINGIGDIICVTPALQALRARYPDAEISVIVRPHLRALLTDNPYVSRVLSYEVGAAWKRLAYLFRLRGEGFDLWVDLHAPTFNTVSSNQRDFLRNALLMWASGARYRLAYGLPPLARHLTHAVPVPNEATLKTENIVDTTVALIDPAARGRYHKFVPTSDADRAWAAHLLPAPSAPRLALFFGSRQAADLWPETHILEFVSLLARHLPNAEIVLIGGEHETGLARRLETALAAPATARFHNLIGKTSFGQTAAVLERCHAFLGTDSGATHIADAVGIPIVALFSSKNYPAIWQPVSTRAVVLNHPVACGPCFKADCPIGNECMQLLSPHEVLETLLQLIDPPRH